MQGIGGGTIFKVGGAKIFGFWSKKWRVSAGRRACVTQGVSEGRCAPLRSWSFFENVGLNEAIWCTIFHHVKHLTACLLGRFFTLQQDGQKSGGAMLPQSEKWRGHWPPPHFRRLWCRVSTKSCVTAQALKPDTHILFDSFLDYGYRKTKVCWGENQYTTLSAQAGQVHLIVGVDHTQSSTRNRPCLWGVPSAIAHHHTPKMVLRGAIFSTPKSGKILRN